MATIGKYYDIPWYSGIFRDIPPYSVIFRHSGFSQRPFQICSLFRSTLNHHFESCIVIRNIQFLSVCGWRTWWIAVQSVCLPWGWRDVGLHSISTDKFAWRCLHRCHPIQYFGYMPSCHCSSLQKHRINRIEQGYDSGYLVNQNNDHYRHASYFKLWTGYIQTLAKFA
jgi:hypothetical protein